MFLYTTSSISINNYFNYKMESKFVSGENEQNYLKHVKFSSLFFWIRLIVIVNSNFFWGKSTFSSDDIFLLCQVCNNSFDQRSKIISNSFSGKQFFKKVIFCCKIIKVLQLNHSQKIVTIVGRTLIEPTHES